MKTVVNQDGYVTFDNARIHINDAKNLRKHRKMMRLMKRHQLAPNSKWFKRHIL